ncbi:MAG: acetolactate synthase small subunit [Alphaproteobacteria bacterium]|nr:acetolactate synthase small subunit [Alphaproteobacteria bacterium]
MKKNDKQERHIIAIVVDNEAGVLGRVVGLFSGRGYNIESLTVAQINDQDQLSRITIVTKAVPKIIAQILALLENLVPTHKVCDVTVTGPYVERELALVKVAGAGEHRIEALRIAEIFRSRVVDSTAQSFVFEVTGNPEKLDAFIDLMKPLGLVEVTRTGITAITRGAESI